MRGMDNWLGRDLLAAAWLAAFVPFAAITMLGGDGPLVGAIVAFMMCAAGAILVVIARPGPGFLRGLWLPLALIAAGVAWAAWPDVARVTAIGTPAERIAPDLVWPDLARALGGMALLIGAAALGFRRGMLRISVEMLCIFGALNLVLGLALRQFDPAHIWGFDKGILLHRFTGTMLNANAMGTVYAAIGILALGALLSALSGGMVTHKRRALTITLFVLLYGAGVGCAGLTGSRTALIGAIAGSALLLTAHFLRRGFADRTALAALAGAGALLAMLLIGGMAAMDRLASFSVDAVKRTTIWAHYAGLAAEAGPFGNGLGSFAQVSASKLPPNVLATDLWYVNSAHNVVIQMIIEGGPGYPMLVGAGLAVMLWQIVRGQPSVDRGGTLLLSFQAALLVILAGGMVDVALNMPGVVALAAVMLGLCWGHALRRAENQRMPALSDMSRSATAS